MSTEDQARFLSQVKGFTPVIDVLAKELGTMTALVYGIVWRYCQMEDKVCRASKETIAAHAHIDAKTVQRHLHKLTEKGYLEDLTPDLKNAPHNYKDTGKIQIIGLVEARLIGGTESPTSEEGRTESPGGWDAESYPGRTESPEMIENHDSPDDGKKNGGQPPAPRDPSPLLPDSDSARLLFGRLQADAEAKRRRGPKQFPSLECKHKFDQAATRLGDIEARLAIIRALEKGITSIAAVTDFIAKWQKNGGKSCAIYKRNSSQRDPGETFLDPYTGNLVKRDPKTGELVPVP